MVTPRQYVNTRLKVRTHLSRARKYTRRAAADTAMLSALLPVEQALSGATSSLMVQTYHTSALQLFGSALETTFRDMPEVTAEKLLSAVNEINRVTIGDSQEAQRDNKDINDLFKRVAKAMNQEIFEQYISEFGGRSYRQGDPSRRSGEITKFLKKKNAVARAENGTLTASLSRAVNDANVPHLFRLNYGTEADPGSKGTKPGDRPPTFKLSIVPGAREISGSLGGPRRPAFGGYPGGVFPFIVKIGAAGQVQLFGNERGIRGRRPSAGIAPSYFIEEGIANSMHHFPQEFRALISRWEGRVARIRDAGGKLT